MKLNDLSDPRYRNLPEEDVHIAALPTAVRLSLFFIAAGWACMLMSLSLFNGLDYLYGVFYVLRALAPIFIVLGLIVVGAYLWLSLSMWMSCSDGRLHLYGIVNLGSAVLLTILTAAEIELGLIQDFFIALSPYLIVGTFVAVAIRLGALRAAAPAWWSLWERWWWLLLGTRVLQLLVSYAGWLERFPVHVIWIPVLLVGSLSLVLPYYSTYTQKEKRVAALSWLSLNATMLAITNWLFATFAGQLMAALGLVFLCMLLYVLFRTHDFVPIRENFEDNFEEEAPPWH